MVPGSRRVVSPSAAIVAAVLAAIAGVTTLLAQSTPGVISGPVGPSPYDVVRGWHKPFAEPGFAFGGNSGVFAESPNRIFVAQRGETRLPDPLPPGVRRFCRLDRHQRAQRHRPPRLAELPLHARRQRQRQGALDAVGFALRGLVRAGTASAAHQPVRSRASRLGGQRNVHHDLRLLQRRQQAAEDARREERPGHRRQAFRQAAGRGLSARRQDSDCRRPRQPPRDDSGPRYELHLGVRRPRQGPGPVQRRARARRRPRGTDLRARSFRRPHQRVQDDGRSRRKSSSSRRSPASRSRSTSSSTTTASGSPTSTRFGSPSSISRATISTRGWCRRICRTAISRCTRSRVDSNGNLYGGDNQYGRTQKFVPKAGADPELLIRPPWSARTAR